MPRPPRAPGPRRDLLGYGIVLVSYLGMAGSAPLVAWADAPAAIILCLRMAFAALALGAVFLRRPMLADWRRPGAAWRLILMAAMSSLTLLLFFYAVPQHQRRHRHVPPLPHAGLGGARGAQDLQVAA